MTTTQVAQSAPLPPPASKTLHVSIPMRALLFFPPLFSATNSNALAIPSRLDTGLLDRAATVRRKIIISSPPTPDQDSLAHPSAFSKPDGSGRRGFCNWLIPHRLMVGQYPGQTPEVDGPDVEQAHEHVRSVVCEAGVSLFCSLQAEIPAQTDDAAWHGAGGQVFLPDPLRRQFPRAFTHYAPIVRSHAHNGGVEPTFLHAPIEDLNVPTTSAPLQRLLSQLLAAMEEDKAVYLHCWGGRGRAGLVGACLVSLIWPELDSTAVLDLVQAGYDSRAGAASMPSALSRSPQTAEQRGFVRRFVEERRRQAR